MSSTVSQAEVQKFDRLAARWWDPNGPMKPLHRMNPARIAWIESVLPPGVRVLDVGCGAGLAAEALARRGHPVLGIDAAADAIDAARHHAEGQGLDVSYQVAAAEELVAQRAHFPAITALEVIEHVRDPREFLELLASLLETDGVLVISTLNRTRRSWLTAKLGAEYLFRMLPAGTHDWGKFITPAELAAMQRAVGLRATRSTGLVMDPLTGQWRTCRDMGVNYMLAAVK